MFQIQIPTPCHEDWDEMTPTQKGAFCKSCAKEVIDFTSSNPIEIKSTIRKEKNPCIRILQSQMDEMNFFEWFRSLILKKKLKYLFLFSFIIAAQNIDAQNQILPQTVAIDSMDILSLEKDFHSETSEKLVQNESITCQSEDLAVATGSIYVPYDFPIDPMPYHVGGGIVPIDAVALGGIIFSPDPEAPYEIEFENQITIRDQVFSFTTNEDTLYFRSVVTEPCEIFLSIEQDRISKKPYPPYDEVFESPIHVEAGEQLLEIPIGKYANGSYTIKIKTNKGEGIGRIMYW